MDFISFAWFPINVNGVLANPISLLDVNYNGKSHHAEFLTYIL
jgi:hypothetical protein